MPMPFEVAGTYGSAKTPATIYVYPQRNGSSWYAVDGSLNVNCTYEDLAEGVDIETLDDHDSFTANRAIESTDDLEREVDS